MAASSSSSLDPLSRLPAEIVLRILDFTGSTQLGRLTQLSKAWHAFIDIAHQDAIYSSKAGNLSTPGDLSLLSEHRSYAQYFHQVTKWKEVCKRQVLLRRNWNSSSPITRESVLQVGNYPVWRFRPDFDRRFFISTSQGGGVCVTDFDTGSVLWHMSDADVRPYAHLEYSNGIAVWDRMGNALEVWKADPHTRGKFNQLGVLNHDVETRGFMLRERTLCVISTTGDAFIYDVLEQGPPELRHRMNIENEAVGHLDQDEENVIFSVGTAGYRVYSKSDGRFVGQLHPRVTSHLYHIKHPPSLPDVRFSAEGHGPSQILFPPQLPRKDRLIPLTLEKGYHPTRHTPLCIDHDDWGAGMIYHNFMIGVSRGGRIFVCSDLKGSLQSQKIAERTCAIIECETDGSQFDLGGMTSVNVRDIINPADVPQGWLSVKNGRVLFEVNDRIYVFGLSLQSPLPLVGKNQPPIFATSTSSAPQWAVPVSWMGIFDDCIMATYTTLGRRQRSPAGAETLDPLPHRSRWFPTKAIRVISLAPALDSLDTPQLPDFEPPRTGQKRRGSTMSDPSRRLAPMFENEGVAMGLWIEDSDVDSEEQVNYHHSQEDEEFEVVDQGEEDDEASPEKFSP